MRGEHASRKRQSLFIVLVVVLVLVVDSASGHLWPLVPKLPLGNQGSPKLLLRDRREAEASQIVRSQAGAWERGNEGTESEDEDDDEDD